ncbi:MAG: hypothetical protein NTX53_17915 [candidate division WOR-3 bacterium]|nr:hypothetical protein [candidate division WOR-3 bacterium]
MVLDCPGCSTPCEAEMAAMEEYVALLHKGTEPAVEDFLQGFLQFADSLRPVLEAAVMVNHKFRKLKARCPELDVKKLLGLDSAGHLPQRA